MIYDCFSYWDEDLLLDLRLNILDKYSAERLCLVSINSSKFGVFLSPGSIRKIPPPPLLMIILISQILL